MASRIRERPSDDNPPELRGWDCWETLADAVPPSVIGTNPSSTNDGSANPTTRQSADSIVEGVATVFLPIILSTLICGASLISWSGPKDSSLFIIRINCVEDVFRKMRLR